MASMSGASSTRNEIIFYLNGNRVKVTDAQPRMTLIEYLRSVKLLTGTKLGCGEGGCGACTVTISRLEHGVVIHRGVNACLAPLCSVDACHVTTVEGIGTQANPHPVQDRISSCHGSQCGYCTPGIVMALYSKLQSNPTPTVEDIEETFDGNLCRCTGYRPILDAAKTFAVKPELSCPIPDGIVPTTTYESNLQTKTDVVSTTVSKLQKSSSINGDTNLLPGPPTLPSECSTLMADSLTIVNDGVTWFRPSTLASLLTYKSLHPTSKLITGNTEVGIETRFKQFDYKHYIHTIGVPELCTITSDKNGTVHVGGAATLAQMEHYCIDLLKKSKNNVDETKNETSSLSSSSSSSSSIPPLWSLRNVQAMVDMLRWFASSQIRNVASLAGNLCTASPISDMNPVLLAAGATIDLSNKDTNTVRQVHINDFFLGYRKTALKADEIVVSIHIPGTKQYEYVRAYKQAKRRDDDISIVNGCIKCEVNPSTFEITSFSTGFGGMAATTIASNTTNTSMVGLKLSDQETTLNTLTKSLTADMMLAPNVPGGMAAFRTTLVLSFGHKFISHVNQEINSEENKINIDPRELSLSETFLSAPRPITTGVQMYQYDPLGGGLQRANQSTPHATLNDESTNVVLGNPKERGPIGTSVMHRSALIQCTGEAIYVDDMPSPPRTLHGCFVLSSRPNGRILHINAKKAIDFLNSNKKHETDVVAFFSASDITDKQNSMGPINHDEELFRKTHVTASGQQLGLIVGSTAELARRAALLVEVTYVEKNQKKSDSSTSSNSTSSISTVSSSGTPSTEEKENSGSSSSEQRRDPRKRLGEGTPIVSIDDAIRENTLDYTRHVIIDGDPVSAFQRDDIVVVEGTLRIGGQEHFYLECNSALAVPGDGGTEMVVYASTQTTTKTQKFAAQVTGLPECRVVARMKRMGGAFGGKETRSVFVSTAAALAASRLNRPVRINLDRDQDMWSTGTRHPFKGIYKACALKETGKIIGLDLELFSNAGFSSDLSESVMDRALFHCENSYKIPNVRVRGNLAMTNTVTNTAFRGFGGPQGMLICETYIEHLAKELKMDVSDVRKINMYEEGQCTPYGQPVENNPLNRLWNEIHTKCNIQQRKERILQYNQNHKWRKRGISIIPTKFGINFTAKFLNQAGALVHVYTDGTVLVSHGGTEMGQGLHTKMIQVAARAFGISVDRVHISESSTSSVPNASPTAASASSDMYGMAVLNACEQIAEKLAPYYIKLNEDSENKLNSADLEKWGDDKSFGAAVLRAYFDRVNLSAQGFYKVPGCGYDWDMNISSTESNSRRGTPFNYFTFGISCSEVEIDVMTGDMRVLRADVMMEMGNPLNPALDIGQIGKYNII